VPTKKTNKRVKRVNNHTGNSQNYNHYSYALNNPLKYTDLYGNTVSWETAVGDSLAGFGGLDNIYSSSAAGFNLYSVSAFGNTTIVSSFGDIGNVKYSANGGLTFENQTAGAYLDELSVGSSGGGGDNYGHVISVANGSAAAGYGAMMDVGAVVDSYGNSKMYLTLGVVIGWGASAGMGYSQTNKKMSINDFSGWASGVNLSIGPTPLSFEGYRDMSHGAVRDHYGNNLIGFMV